MIGEEVERIPDYLFYVSVNGAGEAVNLCSVKNRSDVLEEIGSFAFYNCPNLMSFDCGDELTVIGESAFSGCTALSNVNLPNEIKIIHSKAFYNTALTSAELGYSIQFIGVQAYANCGEGMTIYGYAGTAAETYANSEKNPFVPYALSGTCGALNWAIDVENGVLKIEGTGETILVSGGMIGAVSSGNPVLDSSLKSYSGENASLAERNQLLNGSYV